MRKIIQRLKDLLFYPPGAAVFDRKLAERFGLTTDAISKMKAGRRSRFKTVFAMLADILEDLPPEKLEKYKVKIPPPKKKAQAKRMTEAEKAKALFFRKPAKEQDESKKKLHSLIERLPPRSQIIKNLFGGYEVKIPENVGFRVFRSLELRKALIEATNHAELQGCPEPPPQPMVTYKYSRSGHGIELV